MTVPERRRLGHALEVLWNGISRLAISWHRIFFNYSEMAQSTAKNAKFAENFSLLEANAGFSVSLYAEAANFSSCASIARITDCMESTSASPK